MRLSGLVIVFFFAFFTDLQARTINYITVNDVDIWEEIVLLCRQKNVPLFVTYTNEDRVPNNVRKFQENGKNVKYVNQQFVSVFINNYSQLGEVFKSLFRLGDETSHMIINPAEELLLTQNKLDLEFFKEGFNRFVQFKDIMLKHYNRTLTKQEWLVYLDIKYNNFGYLGTISEANHFIPQLEESDLNNPKLWPFITKLCLDLNNPILMTIRNDSSLVENPDKEFPWLEFYINAYNLNLNFAIENRDSLRIVRMKEELVPMFPDMAKRKYQKLLMEQQYLAVLSKWEAYKKLTFRYLKENNTPEDFYTEFEKLYYGYTFNEVSGLLEEILQAGIDEKSTFKLNYNMAELLIAKGENNRAWTYAKEAYDKAGNSKEEARALTLRQYLMY